MRLRLKHTPVNLAGALIQEHISGRYLMARPEDLRYESIEEKQ